MTAATTDTALNLAAERLRAVGYTVSEQSPGPGLCIRNLAPDAGGESTDPGSDWDRECDDRLETVAAELSGLAVVVQWSDDDLHIDDAE